MHINQKEATPPERRGRAEKSVATRSAVHVAVLAAALLTALTRLLAGLVLAAALLLLAGLLSAAALLLARTRVALLRLVRLLLVRVVHYSLLAS
jgi:hypothetical protein